MSKSIVAIAKDPSVQVMVDQVFKLLGGTDNLIKKGSTVVLKPNAGHLGGPETSIDTNPEVVRAVIRTVKSAGARRVIVAEAAAIGCNTMECLEACGIAAVAREEGAELLDIKSEPDVITMPIRDAQSNIKKLKVPRVILEAEHIINMPILKSHASMVFTGALKNIKGVVDDQVHYLMHQGNLALAMMDIWTVIKCDLSIIDMVRPGGGFGPHSLVPMDFGCIVGSKDPVAADATACRMVGLDINLVAYFQAAKERGIGNSEEDQIVIKGKTIEEVYQKMWFPYLAGFDTWPEYNILKENSCSSCQSLVALTMEKLKALGEYDKNAGMTIVLGAKKSLPEGTDPQKTVLVGNCTKPLYNKGLGYHCVGCPPTEPIVAWAIMDKEDQLAMAPGTRERMYSEEPLWNKYIADIVAKRKAKEAAEKQKK